MSARQPYTSALARAYAGQAAEARIARRRHLEAAGWSARNGEDGQRLHHLSVAREYEMLADGFDHQAEAAERDELAHEGSAA